MSCTVDLKANVTRFPNGTVHLTWTTPPGIQDRNLSIEVNWGEGWIPITPGLHSPVHFKPNQQYDVQLRLRHAEWAGVVSVVVPATPPGDKGGDSGSGLVYGVILVSTGIGCGILLVAVLTLKYIQLSRRETDKGEVKYKGHSDMKGQAKYSDI